MDTYFTVKLWTEYIIPICLGVLFVLIFIVWLFITSKTWDKKIKMLNKYGYQREYMSNSDYKWCKKDGIHELTEYKMNQMKIKELKEWLKNNEVVKERDNV